MDLPKRKQLRLPDYDYSSPGAYFVTICTRDRRCILSEVTVGDGVLDVPNVRLSPYGEILAETLREIEKTYSWLSLDRYVIMPNHIHLLLCIGGNGPSGTPAPTNAVDGPSRTPAPTNAVDGPSGTPAPTNETLPMLVSTFKRFTNRRCGIQLWQRSYHEHVIRSEDDYRQIWEYIENNPVRWVEDRYYIEAEHSTEEKSIY
jgi:REP element-mobilizing transposase RayT